MEKEDMSFLSQLVNSLSEATEKLEKAYNEKDPERFIKAKKFVTEIQKRISELVR